MRKTQNPKLPFIKENWTGNQLDSKNRYKNLDGHSARGLSQVLKWKLFQKNKYADQRKGQQSNVVVRKNKEFLDANYDGITWLGHATFLITLGGKRIITDPILYDISPLKRWIELPCPIENLVDIDCILLSHNHRDHADKKSMKKLTEQNPQAIIYTGLEIGELLNGWGVKNEILEAGWFQKYPSIGNNISISYLPAKHWNRRFLHDLNQMLWGSFIIEYGDKTIYFGADSGFGEHFEMIGGMFDIDVAILGIGAYEPIWFMNASHTSPSDALEAQKKLKAKNMIPMHYGTFDLSDEPIFNPKEELSKLSKGREDVHIIDVGEKFRM